MYSTAFKSRSSGIMTAIYHLDVIASKVLVHKLEKGFRYVRHDILAEWRVEPNYLPCPFLFLVGIAFSALLFVAQVCRVAACSEGSVVEA